jgi:hypothetical protein
MNGDPLDELDEQAAEIARLRSQPCPYVVGRTTLHCSLTPFTLTDAEREAIRWAIDKTARTYDDPEGGPIKRESLRTLLERTK